MASKLDVSRPIEFFAFSGIQNGRKLPHSTQSIQIAQIPPYLVIVYPTFFFLHILQKMLANASESKHYISCWLYGATYVHFEHH